MGCGSRGGTKTAAGASGRGEMKSNGALRRTGAVRTLLCGIDARAELEVRLVSFTADITANDTKLAPAHLNDSIGGGEARASASHQALWIWIAEVVTAGIGLFLAQLIIRAKEVFPAQVDVCVADRGEA